MTNFELKLGYSLWRDPMLEELARTSITEQVIKLLGILALGLGSWFIKIATDWLKAKKLYDVKAKDEAALKEILSEGIAKAEEWGRKTYIKDPVDPAKQIKPTGEMKMAVAIEHVKKVASPETIRPIESTLADRIDARLAQMRGDLSLAPPVRPSSMRPIALEHLHGISQIPAPAPLPAEAFELEERQTSRPMLFKKPPTK